MTKAEFQIKDYELKISYLKDHLTRMWTRFNYMLSIQTVVAGGKFLGESNEYQSHFIFTGFLFAIIWLLLGIQDRYLFVLYRNQVKSAFGKLELEESEDSKWLEEVDHVGQVEEAKTKVTKKWHTQRWEEISSTKMAAIVPMVIAVLWGFWALNEIAFCIIYCLMK